jgi:hypothetical protein
MACRRQELVELKHCDDGLKHAPSGVCRTADAYSAGHRVSLARSIDLSDGATRPSALTSGTEPPSDWAAPCWRNAGDSSSAMSSTRLPRRGRSAGIEEYSLAARRLPASVSEKLGVERATYSSPQEGVQNKCFAAAMTRTVRLWRASFHLREQIKPEQRMAESTPLDACSRVPQPSRSSN